MKHIVMFSGGAGSSVVAKIIADKYPQDTILLHNPTGAEHPDADRFRQQVALYIGLPITIVASSKMLWEMVETYKQIPNDGLPYCTERLKLIPQGRYLKEQEKTGEKPISYVGLGVDEWRRIQRVYARNQAKGRLVKFPLFENRLTGEDCKRIIRNEWGICLPEPYKYLQHNNCIPCYKGGQSHFYKVWKYYPDQFWRAAKAEDRTTNTVFYGTTLRELAKTWETQPEQGELFGEEDSIPCMCSV